MTKLQLALDIPNIKKAIKIAEKTKKYIDIIELGTPLIKNNGLSAIKKFKKFRKPILADLKTMDTGFLEAELAYKNKADISTVCGASDIETIKGAIKASKKHKKKICVDLISVKDIKKIKKIVKLNPDYIEIHTAIDEQKKGKSPISNLKKLSKIIPKTKISIAGGINKNLIKKIKPFKPKIIVIGGSITKSKNPEKQAKLLKNEIIT